jgi:hypothetical protein
MIKSLLQNWYWWRARIEREFYPSRTILMRCAFCGRGVIEGYAFCCDRLMKFCQKKSEVRDGF